MSILRPRVSLLFVSTLFFISGLAQASPQYHWMKFRAKDKFERTQIANLGVTIEAVVEDAVMGLGTDVELEKAKKSGRLVTTFPLSAKMLDFPSEDSQFHNYFELTRALETLAAQNPNLVTLSSLGTSLEGRDIPLIILSTAKDHTSQPAIFFMGGHHAREHVSIETPLQLAQYLAYEFNSKNSRIAELLAHRTVYIAPIINPDGAEFDIATGAYKLWRKNRRANGGSSRGVDLNRNYSFGWGGEGASPSPGNDTYRGPHAFSEPETQAVKNFVEAHKNINITLSFHTFSELILYPWGHKYDSIENQKDFLVHKTMAETMAKWNNYTPQQSSELYVASGDTTDWAYGEHGIISFTFELDPASAPPFNPGQGFYPGQSMIKPIFEKNLEPALYLIDYSDNPYRVLDSKSKKYGFESELFL